jgi:hypothetical protein
MGGREGGRERDIYIYIYIKGQWEGRKWMRALFYSGGREKGKGKE